MRFAKRRCLKMYDARGFVGKILATILLLLSQANIAVSQSNKQIVRMANLVIDSNQLERYKVALREEIETSLRVEPGVLTLYAILRKDKPSHITILEIYADLKAYNSHIKSPHFLKYKTGTSEMVKSLELVETNPLLPTMRLKPSW